MSKALLGVVLLAATAAAARLDGVRKLGVRFEPSRQTCSFATRASGLSISLDRGAIRLDPDGAGRGVSMEFENANPRAACRAEEPLAGQTNRFVGAQPADWRAGVHAFGRVRYRDVYPGIDLLFHSRAGVFEYDWVVAPGADPDSIRMRVRGAERLSLDRGDLVIATTAGEVRWKAPSVYQSNAGVHTAIHGRFALESRGRVTFRVDPYDRTRELVIDPTLSFSTYLGASANESANAVATDNSGHVYIVGGTTSQTLPVKAATQAAYAGGTTSLVSGDAFVAKFDPAGALVYLTYLGGGRDDFATSLAVDAAGNVWIAGGTSSTNFPVSANGFQRTLAGVGGNDVVQLGDAFLAKLGPVGDLQYASYLGGRLDDYASGVALDASGAIYLTGSTHSTDFPVSANAFQATLRGRGGQPGFPRYGGIPFSAGEVFVVKFNPAATQMVYSTYLGGSQDDLATGIAVDAAGSAYVTGSTLSTNFPTTTGAYQTTLRGIDTFNNFFFNFGDGFITKFSPDGRTLAYSTLLGGRGDDAISSIALDSSGNAYVTGSTSSQDFPTTAGVIQRAPRGPFAAPVADQLFGDAFITKLNSTGSALVFSTYFGGTGDDTAMRVALDAGGNIYIAGFTDSRDLPTREPLQAGFGGGGQQNQNQNFGDAFLAKLDPNAATLLFGTYLGGSADDVALGMALDRSGNAFVVGNTVSSNFTTTTGALQRTYGGANAGGARTKGDAFLFAVTGLSSTATGTVVTGLQNAASYTNNLVSPGMIFVVYGSNIGPANLAGAALAGNGFLSTNIANTQILFDGVAAPIVYVSASQSSGIVPYEVAGKATVQVTVVFQGQTSAPFTVPVRAAVPGLFSANFSGTGQGAIFNQDNTPNSALNPARRGDIIVLFGTGEGQTNPPGVTGQIANTTFPKPVLPVTVTIGGQPATDVRYFGAVPQVVSGEFQINVVVPTTAFTGNQPVVVSFGTNQTQINLTVAIQ